MSEKVRAFNLTGGNVLISQQIGPPTLLSSSFNINTPVATEAPSNSQNMSSNCNLTSPTNILTTTAATNSLCGLSEDSDSKKDFIIDPITAQLQFHIMPTGTITADGGGISASETLDSNTTSADLTTVTNSIMNSSQISNILNNTLQLTPYPLSNIGSSNTNIAYNAPKPNGKHMTAQSIAGKSCRFPKLEECAHFHYERVQLGPLSVRLVDEKSELLNSSIASQSIGGDIATIQNVSSGAGNGPPSIRTFAPANCWFIIKVFPHQCEPFLVKRSFDNMKMLDEMLHRCVYDRKISGLKNLEDLDFKSEEDVEYAVAKYLERFSKIASDSLTCGTILTWLQLDNKGRRLPLADGETQRTINTPAVGAAYGVRRYQAQASDEISIEVGDMISVIDMPTPAESIWWRGKKSHLQKSQYEVGFFPQSCVATIGDKVPRHFPMPAPLVGQLDVSPTKPVLRKHGKLIAFFRSFILSRPSRRRLKQSGIYRERVFSCDLSEHLLNSGQDIPMVLKCCAEFIEEYGIVDGIYRLSGITSNIQRLRRAFDEERVPDLGNPEMKQDIHAVSSLLKMYFRELPNPLCTYQLYDNFVEAIQAKSESNERLRLMKETVLKLPPPHYRTLKYLAEHLNKISQHSGRTGMTDKNLAIVWAPNLLRSPALESGGVAALRGVGVQAVVTEYLIRNCHNIFDALEECNARLSFIATSGVTVAGELRLDSLTDCESLLVEQREHDQSLTFVERPKSLSAGGPKLISLEEAQERHLRVDGFDMKQSMPISMVASNAANIGSYIEVGGGPSSLPDKYHTVLSMPRNWQKRKTHSWKSLFTRNQPRPTSGNGPHEFRSSAGKTFSIDSTPLQQKEGAQVTFAESDSIIGTNGKGNKSSLLKQDKPKSIELFETTREVTKPMDVYARSNSIDSLRTTGHSRSVSHDSYFDLLQSPQRSHTNYPSSRELSELGLNFDREEPEMRIFSESESLVSSPRVGKENIPPSSGSATRRIMRARPEEFSSQTNSVNPSPKKQPRLNLLLSPSTASSGQTQNWNSATDAVGHGPCQEHAHRSGDESCCKRYKLEDQLSDIQYIDCGTPEHVIGNPQTLYTSVQVHPPPKSTLSKNTLYGTEDECNRQNYLRNVEQSPQKTGIFINARYSYPILQLGSKRKEQEQVSIKERFSYPGSHMRSTTKEQQSALQMQMEENTHYLKEFLEIKKSSPMNSNSCAKTLMMQPRDLMYPKSRNSYCGSNDPVNLQVLRSNSMEVARESKSDLMDRSKLSVTPISPIQSPRYSLLVGETSSENSSALNTPQYESEPLMIGSAISGFSSGSSTNQPHQQILLDAASSYIGTSHESLANNMTSHSNNISTEKRDILALKREMSLDLRPINSKIPNDHLVNDDEQCNIGILSTKQQQLLPSPNNSNFTDNTSQSVTPSEFGYQHLQRHFSMHSLVETDENSPAYEDYENTPSNLISPLHASARTNNKLPSPIKSTISITYNLKSPVSSSNTKERGFPKSAKTLLETSFDENIVYEQVKLLRDSVTEVNKLLNDDIKNYNSLELSDLKEVKSAESVIVEALSSQNSSKDSNDGFVTVEEALNASQNNNHDIQMGDNPSNTVENNSEAEKLMYQNVLLRKPKTVYENLKGEDMKVIPLSVTNKHQEKKDIVAEPQEKLDLDSLDSIEETPCDNIIIEDLQNSEHQERKSPNFSVKALANKFESSPVEQSQAFDFSVRNSIKKLNAISASAVTPDTKKFQTVDNKSNLNTVAAQSSKEQLKQKLTKSQQITRSLDENAFVREFGAKNLHDLNARSTQQLPELIEINTRRKSFDFTRPKTLNPPKRLPGIPITEEVCSKIESKTSPSTEVESEQQYSDTLKSNSSIMSAFLEHDFESVELKITPIKENRQSLLQNNSCTSSSSADISNSNLNHSTNSLKVLSGVKLDRERIDKIKEERRQQLTQRYHPDSSKSRSKTDLNSLCKDEEKKYHSESLRVKSKSRGDIRSLPKDIENLKELSRSSASMHAGSETTLNSPTFASYRVRSISDEKNQNCDTTSATVAVAPVTLVKTSSTTTNSNSNNTINNIAENDMISKKPITIETVTEEFSARAAVQKFERKTMDMANGGGARERNARSNIDSTNNLFVSSRPSITTAREKISPQFSIRDVTAMFESRSQNQQ